MSSPTVSVVLPNYNYAHYLKERIEGILKQTFQDFELILLDDASTDNSAEILRAYGSCPKVSHIDISTTNSGSPFKQWSKGIRLAKGKYVWLAEADDEASPDFLRQCVEALEQHPDATVCFTQSTYIDKNGQMLPRKREPRQTATPLLYRGCDFARRNLYWRCYIENASGAVFRRDCYEQTDSNVWTNMRSSGDWMFWTQMSLLGDIVHIGLPLNRFRQHTQSTTSKSMSSGLTFLEDARVLKYIEAHFPALGWWRREVRHGVLLRRARKHTLNASERPKVVETIKSQLHATRLSYTVEFLNRMFRFLPWAPTMKRDAITGTQTK